MTDMRNNSRIGKVMDELSTHRMRITSLYLLAVGLISLFYGLNFWTIGSRCWYSAFQFMSIVLIFIALISIIIGVIVWFWKSQANIMSGFALGYIILTIFVILSLYQVWDLDANIRYYIHQEIISSSVVLWGLILLGSWSFALFSLLVINLLLFQWIRSK